MFLTIFTLKLDFLPVVGNADDAIDICDKGSDPSNEALRGSNMELRGSLITELETGFFSFFDGVVLFLSVFLTSTTFHNKKSKLKKIKHVLNKLQCFNL